MRLFTLYSCLITKESYDRWITRRVGDLDMKYLKQKNLKMSVANIREHSGEFRRRARWLWNFATWRTPFRSQRLISQPAKLAFSYVWSASNGHNSISTPNHAPFKALDCWLPELRKWHIVCIIWAPRSTLKVSNNFYPLEFFMLDFSLCFPSLHSWFEYDKGL